MLRKEKAFLETLAGGGGWFSLPHDPPHPAAFGLHRLEKEVLLIGPARSTGYLLLEVDGKGILDKGT